MKIQDIEIKGTCILLGIFGTATYSYFDKKSDICGWDVFQYWNGGCLMQTVEYACSQATMIIFVLDDLHFPIDTERSITCKELELVCKNEEFFNKTIFVKGEDVIDFDKNLVLSHPINT